MYIGEDIEYKTRVADTVKIGAKGNAKAESTRRKVPEDIWGAERGKRGMETYLPGSNARGEKNESAISDGGPGPARNKEEIYQ